MDAVSRKQNKGICYSSKESDIHLIIKILIQKKILEKGGNAATEQVVQDNINGIRKIVDVIDLKNRVLYEVEKEPTLGYLSNIDKIANQMQSVAIVVDLRKIPEDIKIKIKELAKLIEGIVV